MGESINDSIVFPASVDVRGESDKEIVGPGIFISEKAKTKVINLMQDAGLTNNHAYFLRVGVVGGGCSGLSYKMDFDNEQKPMDQAFEDKGIRIVTDLKSFLYLVNTALEFSDGLNGKGFYFNNPNASRSCGCGESFAV
ncbi:MAG: iron-sulfur cluster assembly accessory protein [Ferruginibacter sp.]